MYTSRKSLDSRSTQGSPAGPTCIGPRSRDQHGHGCLAIHLTIPLHSLPILPSSPHPTFTCSLLAGRASSLPAQPPAVSPRPSLFAVSRLISHFGGHNASGVDVRLRLACHCS